MKHLIFALLAAFAFAFQPLQAQEFDHEHKLWTGVMAKHVKDDRFDYAALKKDRGALDAADLEEAVVDGAARRIRPKLMTVLTTFIGLVPILWSTGAGADVMKRIAAPMVGGLASSFLLELLVYPAVFALWKGRGLPDPQGRGAAPAGT